MNGDRDHLSGHQLANAGASRCRKQFALALRIPIRRWMDSSDRRMKLNQFPLLGAIMGFLSAIVSTTGPINAPFYISYGLTQGAYLSTEALGTAGVHRSLKLSSQVNKTAVTLRD